MPRILALLLLMLSWLSPPAFAQQVGVLRVNSTVKGASVWVDAAEIGKTPLSSYYLPEGSHTVRVAANGYDPYVRKVEVKANQAVDVNADLSQGGGTVEFQIEPYGATVLIDGAEFGVTPIRISDLIGGTHTYKVEKQGYEPLEGTFELKGGNNPWYFGKLDVSAGRFSIESTPAGAQVWLDGKDMGVTPLELSGIPAGEHKVAIYLPDHGLVVRNVDNSDGQRAQVSAALSDKGTNVEVKTGSPEATVFISGVPVGKGEVVSALVARGTHELRVEAPQAAPASTTLKAATSGEQRFVATLAQAASSIAEFIPLWKRPRFWIFTGSGVALSSATSVALAIILTPEPVPPGDVQIQLP